MDFFSGLFWSGKQGKPEPLGSGERGNEENVGEGKAENKEGYAINKGKNQQNKSGRLKETAQNVSVPGDMVDRIQEGGARQDENRADETVLDNISQKDGTKGKITDEAAASIVKEPEESWEEMFAEAVVLHRQGVEGDKESVKKAYLLLKKIREIVPENNLVDAYFGSTKALLGRDAVDPMERFKKVLKGLKILDQAVSREPDNVEIRMLRGYVSLRLPETYFHRNSTAVEDFNHLILKYEQNPDLFSQEFYWQLLFDLGTSYKNLGRTQEARVTWQKLSSLATDKRYAELLRQEGVESPEILSPECEPEGNSEIVTHERIEESHEKGIRLRELALSGDAEAAKKAYLYFSKAHEAEPENLLIKAYYADCMSLVSRYSQDPTELFAGAIKAMKIFDSIVNYSPDDVKLRLMRASHSNRLPEAFFRRTAAAITDYEYVSKLQEKDPSTLTKESYWQLLYDLGAAYRRLGLEEESESTWNKLLSLNPDQKFRSMIESHNSVTPDDSHVEKLSLDDPEAVYKEGYRLHDLAVTGDKAALERALELWRKAHEDNPRDSVAQAYYGSCMALSGRESTDPNQIFGKTIKGLVLIKKAVARDWNNPKIRLLRAYLTYSLPESFFHMTGRAIKDFRFLKMAYEQDNSVFSRDLYEQILYDLGEAYTRVGNTAKASKVWSKLLKESANPKYGELLKERV